MEAEVGPADISRDLIPLIGLPIQHLILAATSRHPGHPPPPSQVRMFRPLAFPAVSQQPKSTTRSGLRSQEALCHCQDLGTSPPLASPPPPPPKRPRGEACHEWQLHLVLVSSKGRLVVLCQHNLFCWDPGKSWPSSGRKHAQAISATC